MKKILLPLLTALLTLSAYAQEEANLPAAATGKRPQLLKLVPQEFIVNTLRVDYEVKTGKQSSLQLSPSFTSASKSEETDEIIGAGADLTSKHYLRSEGRALKGFYGGINVSLHRFRIQDSHSRSDDFHGPYYNPGGKHNVTKIGGNLVLGYQFIFDGIIALDLYAGGGIRVARIKEGVNPYYNVGFPDPRYQGIAPKAGFSLGIIL